MLNIEVAMKKTFKEINIPVALGVLIAFILIAFIAVGGKRLLESILVENKIIVDGVFEGFEIGSTKQDVILRAKSLKTIAIAAIPYQSFTLSKSNLDAINEIALAEAIVLDNNKGIRIELQFNKGRVSEIIRSVPASDNSWFSKDEDVSNVIEKIRKILDEQPDFIVWPTISYHDWVYLNQTSVSNLEKLYVYDAWTFPGGERFSNFNMYFENGKLKKINYTRPRVELP